MTNKETSLHEFGERHAPTGIYLCEANIGHSNLFCLLRKDLRHWHCDFSMQFVPIYLHASLNANKSRQRLDRAPR